MNPNPPKRKWLRRLLIVAGILIGLAIIVCSIFYWQYRQNLKPLSSDQTEITVTINDGASVGEIADLLKSQNIIKNTQAFAWYVRLERVNNLQAGTYKLKASMSVPEIIGVLETGKVATDYVTIFAGHRLDEVRQELIKSGFTAEDVDAALEFDQYKDHPVFAGQTGVDSLEGYIYPETFQKIAVTAPKDIVTASLNELNLILDADLRAAIAAQGISVRDAIILASIVEQEAGKPKGGEADPRPIVAQVFLKRLRIGMLLGSDVTALYAAFADGVVADDAESLAEAADAASVAIRYDSPYNTRKYSGLPPGPIGNFSASALEAVANPADTDYLFFLAGDDGKTYYGKTAADHEKNITDHCQEGCN